MPLLSVAGVQFPVLIDALKLTFETIGNKGRNQRGHLVAERRRTKAVIDFSLPPKPLDEAMLYRSLMLGEGEFWNTLTSAFGAKGYQLTGTGVINTGGGGNPIATNGVWRTTTGQTLIVPGKFYDQSAVSSSLAGLTGATLIGWRYDGSAYRIVGVSWRALDTAPLAKREKLGALGSSGVAQAYTGTETMTVAAGALTITAPGSGGPWSWSNLTVYPWAFSAAQVDALMDGFALTNYSLPQLPRVYVTSDLLPTSQLKASPVLEQASLICVGELDSMDVRPVYRNGVFSTTECMVSGRLTEV
jgi:hypothetical protein